MDCDAFERILASPQLKLRLVRWVVFLEMFDFEAVHRAGTRMQHVDSLNRPNALLVKKIRLSSE